MIPVFDLTRQSALLEKEISQALQKVIKKGYFILGPNVSEFEEQFARFLKVKYSVAVASGTDALTLSLMALGVRAGDEVVLPANSYPSVFAITAIGAVPKLVDIDPDTYTINPNLISKAKSLKTKAIMPVHMYGQPADMEKIMKIAKKYKIAVIEDCAQAHGAEVKLTGPAAQVSQSRASSRPDFRRDSPFGEVLHGTPPSRHPSKQEKQKWQKVGTIGKVGCFSFYPTKNLGCFGDGGMVVTNDKEIYKKVKLLRMYGEKNRYNSVILGRNSRLDELQAAILLVKLKYLDKWNKRRREIAKKYVSNIKYQVSSIKDLQLPVEAKYARHVYHLFVIRVSSAALRASKTRDELKKYLEKKGIQTAIHYPKPIHFQPSFAYLGYKKGDFPESEKASKEVLSLPMFPELKDDEIEYIAKMINRFMIQDV